MAEREFLDARYVPYVRDSKRAMDEYISEIFMGGRSTIAVHNTCEDSLLAAPIILDLVILAELMGRIQFGKVTIPFRLSHACQLQALLHGCHALRRSTSQHPSADAIAQLLWSV